MPRKPAKKKAVSRPKKPSSIAVGEARDTDPTLPARPTLSEVCVELRRQGATYSEISRLVDTPPQTVRDLVIAAWDAGDWEPEPVEIARRVETARLDRLGGVAYRQALAGDQAAIRTYLSVSERRARLLGLDAPTRTETTASVQIDGDAARAQLLAALGPAPDDPGGESE